jgi:hypothetical protein
MGVEDRMITEVILKYIGWPFVRDVALPSISRLFKPDVKFFPNRNDMEGLDKLLVTAKRVDAIVIIGRTLLEHKLDCIRQFERVIFPNPEGDSILDYAETVNERDILQRTTAKATKRLLDERIKVRWYPHAIHHTVLLVDADLNSGWVQVESALPFSIPNLRPRWIVRRNRHDQLVISMKDIFEKMWNKSTEPKSADIKRLLRE